MLTMYTFPRKGAAARLTSRRATAVTTSWVLYLGAVHLGNGVRAHSRGGPAGGGSTKTTFDPVPVSRRRTRVRPSVTSLVYRGSPGVSTCPPDVRMATNIPRSDTNHTSGSTFAVTSLSTSRVADTQARSLGLA